MTQFSLARPIENIDSADETMVLGVIHHLMPMLDAWRSGEDLRLEVDTAERAQSGMQSALDQARSAQKTASDALAAAKDTVFKGTAIGQVVAALVGAVLGWWWLGAISAVVVIAVLGGWAYSTAKKAANSIKNDLSKSLAQADALLANADNACQQNLNRIEELKAELNQRAVGFPDVKITPIDFALRSAEVSGHHVLLDLSESYEPVKLKAIDVSAMEEGLSLISDKVQALMQVPPLLTPEEHASNDDPVHELFGEESDLQQMVGQFTLSLGKLRDIDLTLPLVPKDSLLVERAASSSLPKVESGPRVRMASQIDPIAIASFVDQVNSNRERSLVIFSELNEVFSNLERVCSLYAQARVASVNTLHANLLDVLGSAAWCSRRVYCPRTIQSGDYIQELLGIQASRAYLLSFDDLSARLHDDVEIHKRLQSKPDLVEQLAQSYDAVQQFMEGAQFDTEGRRLDVGQRARHIESQFEVAVKHFGNVLQKVMTGSAYPVLNFSTEAQLYYDPDNQEWSSNTTPYFYSTADAIRFGSVVKAYSDLMIPLWEHLWTEKADFRKSELFRTNEEMRRMTEKESEKLIDIANQFRADMRTVRENVYMIESDLRSKYSEIISFRDSMSALGLMSERAAEAVSDEKLQKLNTGESLLSKSDKYETLLSVMPQTQAANRGSVHDPIDLVREPDALLPYAGAQPPRLLNQ
jgi:hypothetical protein